MSIGQLLLDCQKNGISISLFGENLKVRGEEQAVNQFKEKLKHHKQEIIECLQNPKSKYWIVETSDRGIIEVACAPSMTLDEILERVPNAIDGVPTKYEYEGIPEKEIERMANEVIEKAKRYGGSI